MRKFSAVVLGLWITFVAVGKVEAEASGYSRATLKGLSGVSVYIGISSCEEICLYQFSVRTDVELQLRQAGIKVISYSPATLNVIASCLPIAAPGVGVFYIIGVQLYQNIVWPTSEPRVVVQTWASTDQLAHSTLCIAYDNRRCAAQFDRRSEQQRARQFIRDLVNEFINAWLSVNPTR